MTRLFLSYSVTDEPAGRHFVRQLFDRLQQQHVDPWVFESAGGEIAPGAPIAEACCRQIDESDLFVVLIDECALRSESVVMEVRHALGEAGRRRLPIVPLLATDTRRAAWPAPLVEAAAFKGIALTARSNDTLEGVVVHLCGRLGIDYVPPRAGTPRLPLRQRLSRELQARTSVTGYDAGDFIGVLRKCDLAVEAMGHENLPRARRLLEAILTDLEVIYGWTTAYYPRIAYGAVLMAEAHAGVRGFAEVERYFAALIDERLEQLDANAYAGRANALMALGRFDEAVAAYLSAERYLENPDAALFYNMVRARVLGGLPMERGDTACRQLALSDGILTRTPGDLARFTSSLALAHAYVGDTQASLMAWRGIRDVGAVLPEVVVDIAQQLQRQAIARAWRADLDAACWLVSDYIARRDDLSELSLVPLQQVSARLLFDRGDVGLARGGLARLIERFPATPVLHVDAAMFALADGDRRSARRLCEAAVSLRDAAQCHPALSPAEFNFALGHAFWLLGRRPEAEESFRRSEYGPTAWYGRTMPGEFASVQ